MLSNFPVDTFDRTDWKVPRCWPTIGIKLSAQQVPNQVQHVVKGDVSLALGMLGTMQSWYDQMHLNDPAVIKRTIFIDTFGVNATDFSIDKSTQQKLFANGRAAAEKFWLPRAPSQLRASKGFAPRPVAALRAPADASSGIGRWAE